MKVAEMEDHTPTAGFAASLRQMADGNYVDFDELRAAADLIESQQTEIKRLQEIEWMYKDLCK